MNTKQPEEQEGGALGKLYEVFPHFVLQGQVPKHLRTAALPARKAPGPTGARRRPGRYLLNIYLQLFFLLLMTENTMNEA